MRLAPIPCLIVAVLLAAPAHAVIDGKVAGLNAEAFAALSTVKQRNPGSLTQLDAQEIGAAIVADQVVDDAERDLLEEMTQSMFRSITVTLAGDSDRSVRTYPTSGHAKRSLQGVLNPPLDLEAAWTKGASGWMDMCIEFKKGAQHEAGVVGFVEGKLAEQWETSNMSNGYKPLRDIIGKLYGYSNSAGVETKTGRTILYRAMDQLDRSASDGVPDFLYNWTRPSGYL